MRQFARYIVLLFILLVINSLFNSNMAQGLIANNNIRLYFPVKIFQRGLSKIINECEEKIGPEYIPEFLNYEFRLGHFEEKDTLQYNWLNDTIVSINIVSDEDSDISNIVWSTSDTLRATIAYSGREVVYFLNHESFKSQVSNYRLLSRVLTNWDKTLFFEKYANEYCNYVDGYHYLITRITILDGDINRIDTLKAYHNNVFSLWQ